MFAVTIIAANYIPYARALEASFLAHNPGSRFFTLLIDVDERPTAEDFDSRSESTVLTPRDLNLDHDEFLRMALMYDVTELATALKPWALEALLELGADVAVYLDPDIYVYAPLSIVEAAARDHGIALTPHGLSPMDRDGMEPSEAVIMQSGIYNLGFIAVNSASREFLSWWQERLLRDSISAPEQMLFTDQRWIDLVPGYWNVEILKHPGLNVAYWNVDKRSLSEENGEVLVNGEPLHFYHFSGFDPKKPWLLSKHAVRNPRVRLSENPILTRLCADYAEELEKSVVVGTAGEYAYGRLDTGVGITATLRRLYRDKILDEDSSGKRLLPVPFSGHDADLIRSLTSPLESQPLLNEFMLSAWKRRPDVMSAYPNPLTNDARDFRDWCHSSGVSEGILEAWQLAAPVQTRVARNRAVATDAVGINLHGYLTAELGMGELARLVMKATEVAGIPCSPTVNTRHLNRSEADVSVGSNAVVYPIDVLVINADQTLAWAAENLSGGSDRLRVGVWAWEVEEFPDEFTEAFEVLDEVWAISTFSQRAIQRKTNKPVFTIPLPQKVGERESVKPFDFSTVGLDADPYFLVMFDYLSVIDRKNPFAAIEAFKSAFSRDESVRLVIKTINGHQKFIDRERLLHAIGDDPRIHLIEDYLTSDQVTELVCGAVAFVSLHRSEGYGLTCADAMGLRVPVIATAYSGNMDFMNASNSLLVPYSLVPVDASVQVYPPTTVWAEADVSVAAKHMQKLFFDPSSGRSIGDQGYESISRTDTLTQSADFISARIASLMMKRTSPTQVRTGVLRRLARLLPGPVKARLKRLKRLKSAL